jgi:hypothetical protein
MPGAAPCISPRPSDMRGARRARKWLVVRVNKVDRFTIAPLDQTNACRRGYGILLVA